MRLRRLARLVPVALLTLGPLPTLAVPSRAHAEEPARASHVEPIAPNAPNAPNAPPAPEPSARLEPSWAIPILHGAGQLALQRVGAMLLWRDAFSLSDGTRDLAFLRDAYTKPPLFDPHKRFMEWDGDRWQINVIGHGLMGSELYLRARTCGQTPLASLAFTAIASATWEYGIEVWNARPSVNDLIWTPLAGMALGELRFALWSGAGGFAAAPRAIVRAVVDPFGSIERWIGTRC